MEAHPASTESTLINVALATTKIIHADAFTHVIYVTGRGDVSGYFNTQMVLDLNAHKNAGKGGAVFMGQRQKGLIKLKRAAAELFAADGGSISPRFLRALITGEWTPPEKAAAVRARIVRPRRGRWKLGESKCFN
ncbi:hypothetical protein ACJJTC_003305 [Scirpophaga incertulas]